MPVTVLLGHRVTFFWSQAAEKKFGWSENYWNSLTDTTVVTQIAKNLRVLLDSLHGAQSKCTDIRISILGAARKVKLVSIVSPPSANLTGPFTSDYPSNALQIRLTSAANDSTTQWFRGLQDADIARGGRKDLSATSITDFGAIKAHLTTPSNGWAMRILDPARIIKLVTGLTTAGEVTSVAHGYAPGDHVRVSRVRGLVQANKVWRIASVTANTFTLSGWVTENPSPVYLGGGVVSIQQYAFAGIANVEAVRATAHKTGRPFGLAGGRPKRRPIMRVGLVAAP